MTDTPLIIVCGPTASGKSGLAVGAWLLSAAGHGAVRPGGAVHPVAGHWPAAVYLLGVGAGLGILFVAVHGAAAANRV